MHIISINIGDDNLIESSRQALIGVCPGRANWPNRLWVGWGWAGAGWSCPTCPRGDVDQSRLNDGKSKSFASSGGWGYRNSRLSDRSHCWKSGEWKYSWKSTSPIVPSKLETTVREAEAYCEFRSCPLTKFLKPDKKRPRWKAKTRLLQMWGNPTKR